MANKHMKMLNILHHQKKKKKQNKTAMKNHYTPTKMAKIF